MKKYGFEATSDGEKFTYDIGEMRSAAKEYKGKRAWFTVEPFKRKRTLKQNRSMFGIPYKMIAEALTQEWGEIVTVDQVHEMMKQRFEDILQTYNTESAKEVENKSNGQKSWMQYLSTAKLSTIGMMKYYEALQRFGAQFLSIDIPSPNETDYKLANIKENEIDSSPTHP